MAPSIDVVVPVFNRFDLTRSCLSHLRQQSTTHRVTVVDDGSSDDTRARLAGEWPDVAVVGFATSQGFAAACNSGVASGSGSIVVLLNNDVDCRPDFLERLVEPFKSDPSIGSVAALCVRPGGGQIDSIGMTSDVTLSGFPRLQGRPVEDAGLASPTLTGPAGAAAAYRREAWEEVGGLDEHLFAYHEDFELALRLRAAGWGTTVATKAVGVHLGSATHGRRTAWQRRHAGFGRGYVLRRYGLLRGKGAIRSAVTEGLVIVGDAAISRDFASARGRLDGWRAARRLPPRTRPPAEAIDASITLRDAISLRRNVYSGGSG